MRSLSARSSTLFLFLFLISSYNLFSNTEQTFLEQTHITLNTALILIKLQHLILTFICRRLYFLSSVKNRLLFFNLHSISGKFPSIHCFDLHPFFGMKLRSGFCCFSGIYYHPSNHNFWGTTKLNVICLSLQTIFPSVPEHVWTVSRY